MRWAALAPLALPPIGAGVRVDGRASLWKAERSRKMERDEILELMASIEKFKHTGDERWAYLKGTMEVSDSRRPSTRGADDSEPTCPYCLDTHIILNGDEERPCWHCYDFEGHV